LRFSFAGWRGKKGKKKKEQEKKEVFKRHGGNVRAILNIYHYLPFTEKEKKKGGKEKVTGLNHLLHLSSLMRKSTHRRKGKRRGKEEAS